MGWGLEQMRGLIVGLALTVANCSDPANLQDDRIDSETTMREMEQLNLSTQADFANAMRSARETEQARRPQSDLSRNR